MAAIRNPCPSQSISSPYSMGWTLLPVIIAVAVFLGLLLARTVAAERRRSANWDDLRERGKLIASQLAHLREVAARKDPATPV